MERLILLVLTYNRACFLKKAIAFKRFEVDIFKKKPKYSSVVVVQKLTPCRL